MNAWGMCQQRNAGVAPVEDAETQAPRLGQTRNAGAAPAEGAEAQNWGSAGAISGPPQMNDGASSSGRTRGFGPRNGGSIPPAPATTPWPDPQGASVR